MTVDAHAFATEWIEAWNAHDLERVLAHYAEEVELISPRAAQVVPDSGGVIRGKAALRAYWTRAMASAPALRFVLDDVFATISGATVLYRNHRGQRVTETFLWDAAGLVVRTVVAHAAAPADGPLYCVIARVPASGVASFARYEDAVLALLADHGGALDRRVRTADGTTEVHLVRFRDADGLARYRADPRRVALQADLVESGAALELLTVRTVDA